MEKQKIIEIDGKKYIETPIGNIPTQTQDDLLKQIEQNEVNYKNTEDENLNLNEESSNKNSLNQEETTLAINKNITINKEISIGDMSIILVILLMSLIILINIRKFKKIL